MSHKAYKKIEVVGTSDKSISDAIENAIKRASKSLQNLDWFETTEIRGLIQDSKPLFQVTIKVGFKLKD